MGFFRDSYNPASTIDNFDANHIYGKLLYHPRRDINNNNQTYEALNGGIDFRHFAPVGKNEGLEAGCFRSGTFARGYNYGFNFPDRYHASSYTASNAEDDYNRNPSMRLFHVHQSFAVRFFCPWPAICFVGYQGWFNAELSKFGGKRTGERWDLRFRINGKTHNGSYVKIPATKNSSGKSDGYKTKYSSHEYRYRWQQRSMQFNAQKGFNTIEVMNWPKVKKSYMTDDRQPPKLVTQCGGIWVLAIRSSTKDNPKVWTELVNYGRGSTTDPKQIVPFDAGQGSNVSVAVSQHHPDYNTFDVDQMLSIDDEKFHSKDIDTDAIPQAGLDKLELRVEPPPEIEEDVLPQPPDSQD